MLPHILYTLDWSDEKEHVGEVQHISSIDLRNVGTPKEMGLVRLLNSIRAKYPKTIAITLEITCHITEVDKIK